MDNKFDKVICEAVECKEPYETDVQIDGFRLCSFFGYHFANAVYAEEKETGKTVGWDQYENELYLEGPNMETKTYELTRQPELTANVEEVKNMLPTILADGNIENFPVSQFLELIDTIDKDILANYPIYWDKNHEGNREPVTESVPKENVKACFKVLDEYVQKLGFEPYREADWNVSYRKGDNTNYIYYIHFTPVMDEDQLKLAIYKDTKLVEQDVWTIQDVEDIKKAFDKLIISKIEGME